MYQMTPPQPPKPPKKKLNLFQLLVIIGALGFAGWYLFQALAPAAATHAYIQSGRLGARYSGDCIIVRNETPYDAEGVTSIDYIAAEGSTIYLKSQICNVFSSSFSTKEMNTLQQYRDDIRNYQLELLGNETTYDAKGERLDTDVLDRAKEFRQMVNGRRGNMINQETMLASAIRARQDHVADKFSTEQRLTRLYDDERNQQQRIDSWTKLFIGNGESIVSFYTDGYEYSLTSSTFDRFTPAEVRSMYEGNIPERTSVQKGRTTIYRTVQDGSWYVLFLAKNGENWNPVEGQTYELKLERFENDCVNATVVSSTRAGGELLVRLRVDAPVEPVLYTRTCEGELGDSVSTLMVPSRALYAYDNMVGVVVVDGQNQIFIPVQVLLEDGDNVYITAINQGFLSEGMMVVLF